MIKDFDKLMSLTLEIDGLLLIMARHRENTPVEAFTRLKECVAGLQILMDDNITAPDIPIQESNEVTEPTPEQIIEEVEEKYQDNDEPVEEQDDCDMTCQADCHNIARAFTINDKFRFRRELFGNSDAQYAEAIDVISAMTSIDEVEEYLFMDLNWDRENEDVKAFNDIIINYFNNRYGR